MSRKRFAVPPSAALARRRRRVARRPVADPLDGLLTDDDRDAIDPAALEWLRELIGIGERAEVAHHPRLGEPAA